MGLRLNKVLGWGLNDLEPNDERINWERLRERYSVSIYEYFDYLLEIHDFERQKDFREQDITLYLEIRQLSEAFLRDIRSRYLKEQELIKWGDFKRAPELDLHNTTIYNDEGGLKSVIIFLPLTQIDSWRRYADELDYAVHDLEVEGGRDYIEPYADKLPRAPWPYDATWVDARTQKHINHEDLRTWRWLVVEQEIEDETAKDDLTNKFLDMSYNEALQFIRPKVPEEIIRITNFLQIFKNPETVFSTEPMVYTYFS